MGNSETVRIMKNGDTDTSAMAAQKGGDLTEMANFLATDDVPQTLFGIPVVSDGEQYTERDLAFFKEHPEAGGYYDMGDEPDDPSQGDENGGTSLDEMFNAKDDPPYDGSLDDLFEGKPLDPEVLGYVTKGKGELARAIRESYNVSKEDFRKWNSQYIGEDGLMRIPVGARVYIREPPEKKGPSLEDTIVDLSETTDATTDMIIKSLEDIISKDPMYRGPPARDVVLRALFTPSNGNIQSPEEYELQDKLARYYVDTLGDKVDEILDTVPAEIPRGYYEKGDGPR